VKTQYKNVTGRQNAVKSSSVYPSGIFFEKEKF